MYVSIIRQSLRRQQNARNGNDQIFVIGMFFFIVFLFNGHFSNNFRVGLFWNVPNGFRLPILHHCCCYTPHPLLVEYANIPHAFYWLNNVHENESFMFIQVEIIWRAKLKSSSI
jgi:hypothetical protein